VGSEILIFVLEYESRKPLESVSERCEEEDTEICLLAAILEVAGISISVLWGR
jgi:hypothetical protein